MPEPQLDTWILVAHDGAAPAAEGGGAGIMSQLPILLVILGIFYFIVIRPQQKARKEHEEMITTLKKGDEVITEGGLMGKIHEVHEEYVVLELNERNRVRIQKASISNGVKAEDTAEEKKA